MAFVKGQSGNPSGKPKIVLANGKTLRDMAREHTEDALNVLVDVAADEGTPPAARVSAASEILNRGWGRAPQTIADEDGNIIAWFDLLASSQRRSGLIEQSLQIEARHDVN